MAYDFPNAPSKGQTTTGSAGQTYSYDGSKWIVTASGTAYAPIVNPTFTAGLFEHQASVPASNMDLNTASVFSKTVTGATTFTVSNVPTTGNVATFILDLTNGGSATVTWFSGVKWAGGTAPTLTSAGRDVLGFLTYDGGTTWTGLLLGRDCK